MQKDTLQQTLFEQMRFSDVEIKNRQKLLKIGPEDIDLIKSFKPVIEKNLDPIIIELYETLTTIDEIALLIGDADTLHRIQTQQRLYIMDIFIGFFDEDYINARLRIGLVHHRIGVPPKQYLAAVLLMKNILLKYMITPDTEAKRITHIENALSKIFYFDITLVIDTYIRGLVSEIELAKSREVNYSRSLEEKVKERTKQLEALSKTDAMTGVFNVRSLHENLRRDLNSAKRNNQPLSLLYFDVDNFKQINDNLGHQGGDEILKKIGAILNEICRDVDSPCRYGGDEFTVILPNTDIKGSYIFSKRLIEKLEEKNPDVSLSIGLAQTGPVEFTNEAKLISQADAKMYEAKKEEGFSICH